MSRTSRLEHTAPQLVIKYAVTENNFDGSPWPPDGADYWAVVSSVPEHALTIWRHVGIYIGYAAQN